MLIPLDQVIAFFLICGTLVGVYMRLNNKIIRDDERIKTLFNVQDKFDDVIKQLSTSLTENSAAIRELNAVINKVNHV